MDFLYTYDVAVIGGGPAGLAAAIAAKQNGAQSVCVIERDEENGGILNQCIHNGFGLHYFGEELTGPEYAARFIRQAEDCGVIFMTGTMVLEFTESKVITAINKQDGLFLIKARALVLAMGCRERTRGALTIPGTRPAGIFTAGTAQRYVNIEGYMPGKSVVILGSGDIGLIMARRLTLEGAEVKLICELLPYSSGLNRNIVQCANDFSIPIKYSHTITQIHGKRRVEGVTVSAVDSERRPIEGSQEYIECDTLLLSVGLIPENELSKKAGVKLDAITGGPMIDDAMQTGIPGIFACGNVVHVHDLVDYVTEGSIIAGKNAAIYACCSNQNGKYKIVVRAGNRVRYTVPQYIKSLEEDVCVYFRPTDVYKNVQISVYADNKQIINSKKTIVTPGEMQRVIIKKDMLNHQVSELSVNIGLFEEDVD